MPERPLQEATDGGTGALCAQADAETDVAVSATCRQRAAASCRTIPRGIPAAPDIPPCGPEMSECLPKK